MFFAIDPSNGLAIYDQIVRQVMFAVASEALRPGDLVPSVRDMSRRLAVNPNTVARAYRDLLAQGVVATVRGTGMEITPQAPQRCREARLRMIRERLAAVLLEASRSQLDTGDIRGMVEKELAKLERHKRG